MCGEPLCITVELGRLGVDPVAAAAIAEVASRLCSPDPGSTIPGVGIMLAGLSGECSTVRLTLSLPVPHRLLQRVARALDVDRGDVLALTLDAVAARGGRPSIAVKVETETYGPMLKRLAWTWDRLLEAILEATHVLQGGTPILLQASASQCTRIQSLDAQVYVTGDVVDAYAIVVTGSEKPEAILSLRFSGDTGSLSVSTSRVQRVYSIEGCRLLPINEPWRTLHPC